MTYPRDLMRDMFGVLAGGLDVAWSNEPLPMPGLSRDGYRAWVELTHVSEVEMNIDELRMEYDPVLDKNDVIIAGQRQFTVAVTARSLELDLAAYQILGRIRFRLRTNTARNLFVPAGIALVKMESIVHLHEDADNSAFSKANLDVTFATSFRQDPGDDDGVYIATVNGNNVVPITVTP